MTSITTTVTRRSVLEGLGVGALGIAGAALLGCGSTGKTEQGPAASRQQGAAPANTGKGLPMVAPVVQGKPREGGTWTTASTSTTKQHDPHTALAGTIWHTIGEKGLEPDPVKGTIRPHVLTSWEVADPSGTTLVFKVSPNLLIHNKPPWNGRQFTAEDVAWNMMRIGGLFAEKLKIPPASFQRASMVANIVKAEAIDPLTVKVTLSKPNSGFFNGLMDTRVPFAPKEMDDIGWNDPLKMGGIGAYQVSEWVADQKVVYKKWDQYAKFRPNEPHFDTNQLIVVPDSAATQAAFISGQIQILSTPLPDQIATVKKGKPDANLYQWVDGNWNHLRPSMEYAPFKDFRVRKALFLAIDYKGLGDGNYGDGWAYQASLCPGYPEAWLPDKVKALPGFNPETKAADRAESAKLLAAAGFPNGKGLDFDIIYQGPNDQWAGNATRFQGQMQEIYPDMKVTLHPFPDSASFSVPQAAGNFKMVSYDITVAPDAVIEFTSQYHSLGSRNYGHFKDPDLDQLMDKAGVELKYDARTQLLETAQQKFISDWLPMFVLYAIPQRYMVQGNVGGFDTTAGLWFQSYAATTKVCRWFYMDK